MLAVIGGSGLYGLDGLEEAERLSAETRYGPASSEVVRGRLAGKPVAFLARHGEGHSIVPHLVNYRANIEALKRHGTTAILAVCTVGAIDRDLQPGQIAVPDQLIDYTWGRDHTFHEPGEALPHFDFTSPYSPSWRGRVVAAVAASGAEFCDGGTYAAVQGPRFETAAEIHRFRGDGCTVVGMTGMPEAALAREAGLNYAAICPVGNLAAGMTGEELSADEVFAATTAQDKTVQSIVARLSESWSAGSKVDGT